MKRIFIAAAVVAAIIGLTAGYMVLAGRSRITAPIAVDLAQYRNGEEIFITPEALNRRLQDDNLVILDGNHPKVYAKGHIPGAINIGFMGLSRTGGKPGDAEWGTILPPDQLQAKLESLGIGNDSFVVCYSDIFKGPGAGGRAMWQLRMAGLDNVKLLYGGLELWRQSGYRLSTEVPAPTAARGLVLRPYDENQRASRDFVLANLDRLKIVDVRSAKEYSGKDTSRGEARGGHIRNALWLEWTTLLNEKDATPKPAEEIIALMAGLGIHPQDEFILY